MPHHDDCTRYLPTLTRGSWLLWQITLPATASGLMTSTPHYRIPLSLMFGTYYLSDPATGHIMGMRTLRWVALPAGWGIECYNHSTALMIWHAATALVVNYWRRAHGEG